MNMNGGSMPTGPLSPNGVDFSNATQASEFLEALLNDDQLKVIGTAYATYFWYGIVVAVVIGSVSNIAWWLVLQLRWVASAPLNAIRADVSPIEDYEVLPKAASMSPDLQAWHHDGWPLSQPWYANLPTSK